MTSVVVDDIVSDRTTRFSFPDNHKNFVKMHWDKPDKLLVDLKEHSLFRNRTRWCDLDPLHFRVLLVQNLELYSALSETDLADENVPTIKSLKFLLMALIYCIEQRSMLNVRFLTVTRHTMLDVAYEVSARFEAEMGFLGPRKPRLSLIVDNT